MLLSFIFCLYLYLLSAATGWQTFSCFILFCLPTFCEPGRHILYFHAFVCRRWLNTADKLFTFMLLSAAAG